MVFIQVTKGENLHRFKQNDSINYDIHFSIFVQMHKSDMKNIFKHQIKVQVHVVHSKLYSILEVVTYI